jgi:hypothetical protein
MRRRRRTGPAPHGTRAAKLIVDGIDVKHPIATL